MYPGANLSVREEYADLERQCADNFLDQDVDLHLQAVSKVQSFD